MSKHKHGKHYAGVGSAVRLSIERLSAIHSVARVLVGHMASTRVHSHPAGYVKVQRITETAIHLVCFEGSRLTELTVIPAAEVSMTDIATQIQELWSPSVPQRQSNSPAKTHRQSFPSAIHGRRWQPLAASLLNDNKQTPTLSDVWPKRHG
jgi:hypothetical protein